MKRIAVLIALITFAAVWSCGCGKSDKKETAEKKTPRVIKEKENYAPAEKEAEQILLGYINRDLELLKKHASGIIKSSLNEKDLDRPDENDKKQFEKWDGTIKEIRYDSQEVTFEVTYYAYACYSGDPEKDEKIYAVQLKSKDKKDWFMSMNPLRTLKSSKFKEMSETLPE